MVTHLSRDERVGVEHRFGELLAASARAGHDIDFADSRVGCAHLDRGVAEHIRNPAGKLFRALPVHFGKAPATAVHDFAARTEPCRKHAVQPAFRLVEVGVRRVHRYAVCKQKFHRPALCGVGGQPVKRTEYEGVVERLDSLYGLLEPYSYATDYYGETAYSVELVRFALGYNKKLTESMLSSSTDRIAELRKEMKKMAADFYKDYFIPIDRESFVAVMEAFDRNVTDDFKPEYFKESLTRYGTMEAWADSLWNSSVFADSLKLKEATDSLRLLSEDPAVKFGNAFDDWYKKEIRPVTKRLNSEITLLNRDYMRGQMEFSPDRVFYPDANLTLRVAYGSVQGYSPADGIYYKPVSTLEGIMEKDNPEIFDYNIPQRLREIHAAKDYGPYTVTDSKGNITVPVCFIATNHTSGGNSGSPVINADGDLIGINFDRVWEGTMSDIVFDPDLCRNISLDIRYVLFIIDKVAGAGHLLEEMDFVSER